VRPDNTYEVLIDNEKVESGNLEDDWDFLAPKKIKDPSATKPEDWDDKVRFTPPSPLPLPLPASATKNLKPVQLIVIKQQRIPIALYRPPFPIPMTRSPRTGTSQSTSPTPMPPSPRIGTMRWTASGSHQ